VTAEGQKGWEVSEGKGDAEPRWDPRAAELEHPRGKGGGGERAGVAVTAPETCQEGLSFAPKSHLSRTSGSPQPGPGAATCPSSPAGMGRRRREESCPFLSSFGSKETKNQNFQM